MKIGIVLNRYPVVSETFIESFLSHLVDENVVLYAQFEDRVNIPDHWVLKPFIGSRRVRRGYLYGLRYITTIPFYWFRFITLIRSDIPLKLLIHDIPIWTTHRLDILHFPFGNNAFGRQLYASMLGARMTLSFRGSDLNVFPVHHQMSYRSMWSHVHAVHCNSEELAAGLQEHGIPGTIPVTVIPPAVRADLVDEVTRKPSVAGKGSFENPWVILSLGRLHWVKDYPLALRAMALLRDSGVHFRFHILGEGPEREHLMFLRHFLGLGAWVHFEGKVTGKEIARFFGESDIYLQTSLAEGFSNACLEAQAFGLPCIVPAISGMQACVEDGVTGIIVKDRLERSFVNAFQSMIQSKNVFEPDYIAQRIRKVFSLDRQKREWLKFFDSVLLDKQQRHI